MIDLDQETLGGIIEWGNRLEGFKESHAIDGLTCVQGYLDGTRINGEFVPGVGAPDSEARLLFAIDLAWTFWLDDCFDVDTQTPVDISALLDTSHGVPTTTESHGYHLLKEVILKRSRSDIESNLWVRASEQIFKAWDREQLLTSGALHMSYAEYLELGINSTTVPQMFATISITHGLDMVSRLGSPAFERLVRNLGIISRLQNDYYSLEKERKEGCQANAILLMEEHMTQEQAATFIESERIGYETMLEEDIAAIGDSDFFCRLARAMVASHERLYLESRPRYTS